MGTITKIEATYSQKVAPQGSYDNKEASATIAVAFDELDTETIGIDLDAAMSEAHDVVRRYLGIGGASKAAPATSKTAPPATSKGNISENPEDRKDPADVDVEVPTPAQKAAKTRAANKAKKAADKAAATDVDPMADVVGSTDEAPVETADAADEFDIMGDVNEDPAEEVTDGDLQTAINLRLKKFKEDGDEEGVTKVKAAIKAFAPDEGPFSVKQLPQGSRRKFIDKLEAL